MTDNLNTPSLPEVKPLSRRDALAGLAALSAVAVPKSGSADAAKAGAQPISLEQMAAMDFEPWTHVDNGWRPPSNQEWIEIINPHQHPYCLALDV